MFQRNALPASSNGADPEEKFVREIDALFAENIIGGERAERILESANEAGVKMVRRILKRTKMSKKRRQNACRDMRRRRRKNDKWPDPYEFTARVMDQRRGIEIEQKISILLPSEILEAIWTYGCKDVLLSTGNYDKISKDHLNWMKEQLNAPELWGFGLHGDGVPCNYDRTESVVVTSINLPGLTGQNGRLRIPIFVLPQHAISENTMDDIYSVLAWDMRSMQTGVRPVVRHDGAEWTTKDRKRSELVGSRPFKACLVQVRADWEWLIKCYHFPGHNTADGACWLCTVKRSEVPVLATRA